MTATTLAIAHPSCSGPHLFRRTSTSPQRSVWTCHDCGLVRVIPKAAR